MLFKFKKKFIVSWDDEELKTPESPALKVARLTRANIDEDKNAVPTVIFIKKARNPP